MFNIFIFRFHSSVYNIIIKLLDLFLICAYCRRIPIFDISVVCDGVGELEWKMDSYRSNFMGLSSAIADEIAGTKYGCRQVKITMTRIANTGIIVNVVDDRSLMELFDSNDPNSGCIHLQVDIEDVVQMSPSSNMNQNRRSSGVVIEEVEDDPPIIDRKLLLGPATRGRKMKAKRKFMAKGKGKDNRRRSKRCNVPYAGSEVELETTSGFDDPE